MGDLDATVIAGVTARGYRRAASGTGPWDQFVVPVRDRITSFQGRAATFITPGRAAVGQKILALHNATASSILVDVRRITASLMGTVAKAVTVVPPVIRVHRFTAIPTNGTALGKVALDTSQSSNSAVTAWGDASADGTGSGTTLTITIPASSNIEQIYAPRIITAVGEVGAFRASFLDEQDITLRALEGVCIFLDQAVVTTGNPATDRWIATVDWEEYTRP